MKPGRHRSETGPTRDSDETKALRLEMAKHIAAMKFEPEAKQLEKIGAPKEQTLGLNKRIDEFADFLYHSRPELLDKLAEQNRRTLGNMAGRVRETGSGMSLSNLGKQALAKLGAEFKAFLSDSGHSETGRKSATDSSRTAEPKTTRTTSDATPTRETGKATPETKPVSEKKLAGSETTPSSTPKDTFNLRLLREAAGLARARAESATSSPLDQVRDSTETDKKGRQEGVGTATRGTAGQLSDAHDCPSRPEHSVLAECKISSETDLQRAIRNHSDLLLRKDFDAVYSDAVSYIQGRADAGLKGEVLVRELERLELRRMYECVHGGPPAVQIESIEDLKHLADGRSSLSSEELWLCGKYFELKDRCSKNQAELSKTEGVTEGHIWKWSLGIEPVPIRDVRRAEEERVISDWATRTESSGVRERGGVDPEVESTESAVRRLPVLPRPDVEGICAAYPREALTPEDATAIVHDIIGKMQDTPSRFLCAELGEQSVSVESPLSALRSTLHQNRELVEKSLEGLPLSDGSIPHAHLPLVDNRLCIWMPDTNPMSLVNAYAGLYFYFRDNRAFVRLMEDVKESLDGNRTGGLHKTVSYAEKLVHEMFGDALLPRNVENIYGRIRGDHLHFLLDLLDRPLKSLEGDISKVAGPNGHGGIPRPKFPHGEELDLATACLTGVVFTDCHLKKTGFLTLKESEIERVAIIERSLRSFGDITLNAKWNPIDNNYVVNFPTVLGRMLQHLGVPSGDRTIQNPGLPKAVFGFSWKAKCVLVENIVPQDGTVSESAISWTHSNALHPGKKGERYGVHPVVDDTDIAFTKKHGRENDESWALAVSKLDDLRKSPDRGIASAASALLDKVNQNRNRLIDDGHALTESIGVSMTVSPRTVHYFKKTGRVTVSWEIRTTSVQEAVKLAIVAPPDDVKKKQAAKNLLTRNSSDVKHVVDGLAAKGINVEQWWKD